MKRSVDCFLIFLYFNETFRITVITVKRYKCLQVGAMTTQMKHKNSKKEQTYLSEYICYIDKFYEIYSPKNLAPSYGKI